ATSGGFYRAYHVMQGIDEIIPVDVYIPGCPPTPEALIQAIIMIQELISKEVEIDANTRRDIRERLRKAMTETAPEPLMMAGHQAVAALPLVQITREPVAPQNPILAALDRQYPDQILDSNDFRGDLCITIKPEHSLEICRTLKENPSLKFNMLSTVTALDYLGH